MGNVLIRWDPRYFCQHCGIEDPEEQSLLYRECFMSPAWVRQDHGLGMEEDTVAWACSRLPRHLHTVAEELIRHWEQEHLVIDGMYELAEELHRNGYPLFLATNAGLRHREYWPGFPVSRFFPPESVMLSAEWKLLKPDPAFYRKAEELYGVKGEDILFIDDNPANVESAILCGWKGVVFHGDAAYLRKDLRSLGIRVSE